LLNRSDLNPVRRAIVADPAQVLRGGAPFGGVAFREKLPQDAIVVQPVPGYADCLPVRGGGCWSDPAKVELTEVSR